MRQRTLVDRTAGSKVGLDRRGFLRGAAAVVGGALIADPAVAWAARQGRGRGRGRMRRLAAHPYGELSPVPDMTTGLPLLQLPRGFRYATFSWRGDLMSDGIQVPSRPDGMAVVRSGPGFRLTLIRNHEIFGDGRERSRGALPPEAIYDPRGPAACTRLHFARGRWRRDELVIAGISGACAGGPTPWGTWLACEETTIGPADSDATQPHGFVFEVPARGYADARPILGMGRMQHEAAAVDPHTGIVYLTEDRSRAGLYRYVPNRRPTGAGDLRAHGGMLQMLKVAGQPGADLSDAGFGAEFPVEWVTIAEPETEPSDQGFADGAARFRRNEGAFFHGGQLHFVSTGGGAAGFGQVFRYDPARELLRVIFDSASREEADNPDNMTVSPRGGILLCEDGERVGQRLSGLTHKGEIYEFARNDVVLPEMPDRPSILAGDYRDGEWAGATFDRHGRFLFANLQSPGITFAITGPFRRGPL